MRIVGFDLGTKTLGVAVSDTSQKIAFSKETIRYENEDLSSLAQKACEYLKSVPADMVVLGLPKHMNGDMGDSAKRTIAFKEELLKRDTELKVELWDERLTTKIALNTIAFTKIANKAKKRHEKVDSLAAQNILQSYLDRINRV